MNCIKCGHERKWSANNEGVCDLNIVDSSRYVPCNCTCEFPARVGVEASAQLAREIVLSVFRLRSDTKLAGEFERLVNRIAAALESQRTEILNAREVFAYKVLALFDYYDGARDLLFWRRDGPTFFVNVNDVFAWGTADLEQITPDNIDELERAFKDCEAVDSVIGELYGPWLFAARVREMRPQGASYPDEEEFWPLFDACGPERDVGFGNPYRPGEYKPHVDSEYRRGFLEALERAAQVAEKFFDNRPHNKWSSVQTMNGIAADIRALKEPSQTPPTHPIDAA